VYLVIWNFSICVLLYAIHQHVLNLGSTYCYLWTLSPYF